MFLLHNYLKINKISLHQFNISAALPVTLIFHLTHFLILFILSHFRKIIKQNDTLYVCTLLPKMFSLVP